MARSNPFDDSHADEMEPGRISSHDNGTNNHSGGGNGGRDESDLQRLETKLENEVDTEFFTAPKQFHTLQRVIDVLGHQLNDKQKNPLAPPRGGTGTVDLVQNPVYCELKAQQAVVENAIEHMSVMYCTDLNRSVIQVGSISRQFEDAVGMVGALRHHIRDIKKNIGAGDPTTTPTPHLPRSSPSTQHESNHPNTNTTNNEQSITTKQQQQIPTKSNSTSLRELWLKKLECEAVLTLLDKLEVIRAAPGRFDYLIQPANCRIGAAVMCLSQALSTMFSDDVAQVQALNKILEQLMLRKQKAEELIWDILHEIVYLRTANGGTVIGNGSSTVIPPTNSAQQSNKNNRTFRPSAPSVIHGIYNPFMGRHNNAVTNNADYDDDAASVGSDDSGSSLFSVEEDNDFDNNNANRNNTSTNANGIVIVNKRMMIPHSMVEAELDLEADERRILEEVALQNAAAAGNSTNKTGRRTTMSSLLQQRRKQTLPRYADPVMALRILVESLAQLKRIDDVERVLSEGINSELRLIVKQHQAKTFARLESRRHQSSLQQQHHKHVRKTIDTHMKPFRRHLTNILSSFGCILVRISHLAQILRHRIYAETGLMPRQTTQMISQVLHPVLVNAEQIMQREIKEFLKACIDEAQTNDSTSTVDNNSMQKDGTVHEVGLFSLGIIDTPKDEDELLTGISTASRSNVMEMSTSNFVATVLFSNMKGSPKYRHALTFRRIVSRWTKEVDTLKQELATVSGQDTTLPSFNLKPDERAIEYLDKVIKVKLLPVMQQEAVNGTVMMLERVDAFDHVKWNVYGSRASTNNGPLDVDMCKACQALHQRTEPLFDALHRLPRGGEMYLPLVAVLEHVILTFISRVKQQVNRICGNKTALRLLLMDSNNRRVTGSGSKTTPAPESLSQIVERRWAFTQLLRAYADGDLLEASATVDNSHLNKNLSPLTPSMNDTNSRIDGANSQDDQQGQPGGNGTNTGLAGNAGESSSIIENEEYVLQLELMHMKPYFNFILDSFRSSIVVCNDEELMKASCLAHSLLKLSSQLESRLRIRNYCGSSSKSFTSYGNKNLTSTRALREAIKTIKSNGIKMAKFCRFDMLMQTITRLSKICKSSTLVARDAVRIPSSVNELGEYMTGSTDNIREAAGNAIAAYTFSSLEQYIPVCLMETVRVIAKGEGIITKGALTMNGVEALDRSGSVLYRDLKGATSFDNSYWDVELAAVSFERSASFIAMMELHMDELVAYYTANQDDFTQDDFRLIFSMDGPRRRGDLKRFLALQQNNRERLYQ